MTNQATPTIHAFSSPGAGSVNSYAVEGPGGLVLIDAQRQLQFARAFLAQLQTTGKPISAIAITHEHPDHIGGIEIFRGATAPGVPIYALQATIDGILNDEKGYIALASSVLREDYARPATVPTHPVSDGEIIKAAGLTFKVHDLGHGEGSSAAGFELVGSGVLFCGDLIANRMAPFLFEGRSAIWLSQLAAFPHRFQHIRKLYPGHGQPGEATILLSEQAAYITRFRELVGNLRSPDGTLTGAAKQDIETAMESEFPGFAPAAEIPNYIGLNADAVAREMTAGMRDSQVEDENEQLKKQFPFSKQRSPHAED